MAATLAMTRWRTASRLLLALAVVASACWIAGFVWFLNANRRVPEPPPDHTDGIVALTGGAGRVELALRLLVGGQADKLLLSGIGGGFDLAALGRRAEIDTSPLADRITIGRYAASTHGNGVETAAWAEQNRIHTLIVVTAAFHMPRALEELHRALPDVQLFPVTVRSATPHMPHLKQEAEEYTKFLLTTAGLSDWFPHRESGPMAGFPQGAMR
jgi:uncharacterized SAM-binding protein YcdF (DUF218 family)